MSLKKTLEEQRNVNKKIEALAALKNMKFDDAVHYIIYNFRNKKESFNAIMQRHGIK